MYRAKHSPFKYTQAWLIFTGLQLFACFMLYQYELLLLAFTSDNTYISIAIMACYLCFSALCGIRSIYFDLQHRDLDRQLKGEHARSDSLSGRYFHNLKLSQCQPKSETNGSNSLLVEVLVDDSHQGHELGWYICSVLVKAGMIGTVIGFVLMLQSVSALESFDITQMQELLITMSAGMGVALYTTLMGVLCSALLGYQYLQLDRAADTLVTRTIEAGETGLAL